MRTQLHGPVLLVGCGLVGTSVALALTRAGHQVHLRDLSPRHAELAQSLGAGTTAAPAAVELVVVAVPPAQVGPTVVAALAEWPDAVVTDVSSVKVQPLRVLRTTGVDLARYVGGHPMAGGERSGPMAASAGLFEGRAWAVTPHEEARPEAVDLVRALALACGASVTVMDPTDHDAAVARVSHLPHLLSVLTAAQLNGSPSAHLVLSGQGLRDVTRIAAGDPVLWDQIVAANADQIAVLLRSVRTDIDTLLDGLDGKEGVVSEVLTKGVAGTSLIPGKHGAPEQAEATVFVQVPDQPGELARLFSDTEESGVNIEDLRIDHDLGRPVGVVEVGVRPDRADHLVTSLTARGWVAHR